MSMHETALVVLHLLFAGLWAGAVAFTAYGVIPTLGTGGADPSALRGFLNRLTRVSRASAIVLLLTGGAMAGEGYGGGRLLGSTDGHLVISMVVLWAVLAALVEVGASRVDDGLDVSGSVGPDAARLFRVAAGVGILLLVVGGLLST